MYFLILEYDEIVANQKGDSFYVRYVCQFQDNFQIVVTKDI